VDSRWNLSQFVKQAPEVLAAEAIIITHDETPFPFGHSHR
jgi:hypothetical protein